MLLAQPPYPNKFIEGDIVVCNTRIEFMDGEVHNIGQEILVTEKIKAYYNVCNKNYDKKSG